MLVTDSWTWCLCVFWNYDELDLHRTSFISQQRKSWNTNTNMTDYVYQSSSNHHRFLFLRSDLLCLSHNVSCVFAMLDKHLLFLNCAILTHGRVPDLYLLLSYRKLLCFQMHGWIHRWTKGVAISSWIAAIKATTGLSGAVVCEWLGYRSDDANIKTQQLLPLTSATVQTHSVGQC